jgi:hypothetical protein
VLAAWGKVARKFARYCQYNPLPNGGAFLCRLAAHLPAVAALPKNDLIIIARCQCPSTRAVQETINAINAMLIVAVVISGQRFPLCSRGSDRKNANSKKIVPGTIIA